MGQGSATEMTISELHQLSIFPWCIKVILCPHKIPYCISYLASYEIECNCSPWFLHARFYKVTQTALSLQCGKVTSQNYHLPLRVGDCKQGQSAKGNFYIGDKRYSEHFVLT